MGTEHNIYSRPAGPDDGFIKGEADRHIKQPFPEDVSKELIGDPSGLAIANLGCGGSAALEEWVTRNGGSYVGVDINTQLLELHRQDILKRTGMIGNSPLIEASVSDPGLVDLVSSKVNVAHLRFVLEHIVNKTDKGDEAAIRNAVELAGKGGRVIIIEYNWNAFEGSQAMNEWVGVARELLEAEVGIELDYGEMLVGKVDAVLAGMGKNGVNVESETFSRKDSGDTAEFFKIAAQTEKLATMVGKPDIHSTLSKLTEKLKTEHDQAPGGMVFTPPDIVTVKVGL